MAFASLCYRSARLNVVGVDPKGSKCNLKNLECTLNPTILVFRPRSHKAAIIAALSRFCLNDCLSILAGSLKGTHGT